MPKSVLADDLKIKGSVTSKGDIQLDGEVEGDVSARTFETGRHSEVRGHASARKSIVRGKIEGDVKSVSLQLASSAKVEGDVTCKTISVDERAVFDGTATHVDAPLEDNSR